MTDDGHFTNFSIVSTTFELIIHQICAHRQGIYFRFHCDLNKDIQNVNISIYPRSISLILEGLSGTNAYLQQ